MSRPPDPNDPFILRAGVSVQSFLDQDFYEAGKRDGQCCPSPDPPLNYIRALQETFQFRLDLAIERQRIMLEEIVRLQFEGDKLTRDQVCEQNQNLTDCLQTIDRLEAEKELSYMGKGWLTSPILAYRRGFKATKRASLPG